MCIPIFLQGHDRLAARTSLWMFHQAAKREANGKKREDMEETLRLFLRYYVRPGSRWIGSKVSRPSLKKGNLSQTGGDLSSAKTGIIMYPLENWTERGRRRSIVRCGPLSFPKIISARSGDAIRTKLV